MTNQKPVNYVSKVKHSLLTKVKMASDAMPKGVNSQRLMLNACAYLSENDKLMEACQGQQAEVSQILYNLVATGLDLGNKEAYILPFLNRKTNKFNLTVVKDYKGLMKQARMFSVEPIVNIISRVVYDGDKYFFDNKGNFTHEFDPFELKENEKRIGVFCTVFFKNDTQFTEFLNVEEIQKIQNSTPFQNAIWEKWTDSMWRKSAVRKAMKFIALDFGSNEATKADVEVSKSEKLAEGAEVVEEKPIKQVDLVESQEVKTVNISEL